jgi:ParB-like chromosome segregation protein Spo0J
MSPAATAEAVAPPSVGPGFFHDALPLEQLQPSPLNPRKHFDQAAIEELAKSIREIGVIEPLVARPDGDHYEIVAGERRYRASTWPASRRCRARVKHLTDAQALEIMVVENNQREDVNALEEADGFSRLLKIGLRPRSPGRAPRAIEEIRLRPHQAARPGAPAKELLLGVLTPGTAFCSRG